MLIGASGGLSGLVLFYVATFPRNRLTFRFLLLPVPLSAVVYAVGWFLWQLFLVTLQQVGATDVSALAHLGGALAGLAFFLAWRRRQ